MRRYRVLQGACVLVLAPLGSAFAAQGDWEKLTAVKLSNRIGNEMAPVGRMMGRFDRVRIKAERGPSIVRQVIVRFGNGRTQDLLTRRRRINVGEPLSVDLKGRRRFIRDIAVRARQVRSRRATESTLVVEGRSAGRVPTPGGYDYITTSFYETGRRRIRIRDAGKAGPVTRIRLRALDSAIRVRRAAITFGNGRTQTVRIQQRLGPGDVSEPITLRGQRGRGIRQIRLAVRSPDTATTARIQVLATTTGDRGPAPPPKVSDEDFVERGYAFGDSRSQRLRVMLQDADYDGFLRLKHLAGRARRVESVTVAFADGRQQEFTDPFRLAPGELGPVLRLRDSDGAPDAIKNVSIALVRPDNPRRGAIGIAVLGAEAPDPPIDGRRFTDPPELRNDQPVGYVFFGRQEVGFKRDRDRIDVGRRKGQFDRVAFLIRNRGIRLRAINIIYANGDRDTLKIRRRIRRDTVTPAIRLKGDRFIDAIELVYRAFGRGDGPAVVEAYGNYSDRWANRMRRRDRGWELLGSQEAQMFSRDTDVFRVGRGKGRFTKLRLRARKADLRIYSGRITYGNGDVKDLPLSGKLGAGEVTDDFKIRSRRGRGRFIESVRIRYRSRFNFRGEGTLELWGGKGPPRRVRGGERDLEPEEIIRRGVRELFRN